MHLMIDLETLGITEKCPVIAIGAVLFDINGIQAEFYQTLDVEEQISSGKRIVDGSTIKWWMGQDDAAKKVFKEQPFDVFDALTNFHNFLGNGANTDKLKPWGNGSTFDISILESLVKDYGFADCGSKEFWKFYNIRDYRTFKEFVYDGKDLERKGTHHNALDDAIYQAEVVIKGMNKGVL